MVSRLVKIPGIVVSASGIRAKATKIAIQCRSCNNIIPNLPIKPGLEGYSMPRKCNTYVSSRLGLLMYINERFVVNRLEDQIVHWILILFYRINVLALIFKR